jgi:hypothetical protein
MSKEEEIQPLGSSEMMVNLLTQNLKEPQPKTNTGMGLQKEGQTEKLPVIVGSIHGDPSQECESH